MAGAESDTRAATGVGRPAFGALVRRYRHQAALSQAALAERAGLSTDAVSVIERGRRGAPRPETVALLAEALGLSDAERAVFVAAARAVGGVEAATTPADPGRTGPHSLPAALSSFVGREREVAAIRARLREPQTRLLTLTGAGGVGKTRLALAVAEGLHAAFADGACLAELAPLAEPTLLPGAVAQALGLREEAGRPVLQTLAEHLRGRQLLLVLDNCEHLVAACAALASTLLRACPGLRLLATSREALGVSGERRYRVPPLTAPDPRHPPPVELLGSYEAVRLFVARAQERQPGFALTEHNARAVAAVCTRLDGIPLAIELAAARVGVLPVEAIAERLDDCFRLLTGGPRDAPSRQRTLRASLDWSYDLLGEPERALLRWLAVFADGWTLEAAEAVCAGEVIAAGEVLDLLAGLANKSLVQLDEAGTGGEGARYRLLEPVRQYGGERLAQAGEQTALRDRHLAWCVALAEEAEPELGGPEQGLWLERLEAEHDNLRAALGWATGAGGAAELGMRLAAACWRFWFIRGHWKEGRTWLEHALRRGGAPAALRARVLNGAAGLAQAEGDSARARALYEQSLALRRALGDEKGVASSLTNLGLVARVQGDYARARAWYEESLAMRRALGDSQGIANTLVSLGIVAAEQGDYARARVLDEESLALFRSLRDRHGIALSLASLGIVAHGEGDYAHAQALHEEALALRRALGASLQVANSLSNLGAVAADKGDHARAAALLEECAALCRALGERRTLAYALSSLGEVAADQGDHARAGALLEEGLALFRALGEKVGIARALEALSAVRGAQGAASEASVLLGAAAALRAAAGIPPPPNLRARNDRAVATARAALGEAAFAAGWAEGQAMTLERAIAGALGPEADAVASE